ncbi:helix-turn-helix domain-containing protein [Streptomyces boncukensis]|uniref:Helix-turn-helix transcriptional regulator n=1 Tax=Streptomyces boncukensis TaxID=2711219 RepID=A0A6G4XA18_9ACTN|nr:helix-turn-helix transcriptional regulator [Streptomyces boncukensis]NGO73594.1 helix-turn-helix transcriptional regulator [Streptomyces boncukensis]
MPPRSTPTVRQQRLGLELRKLRERSGMSALQAGALLGVDQARMSNIESGRAGISAARIRTLACNYDCPDEQLTDALAAMASGRARHWWDEYRGLLPPGLLDLAELEYYATVMRTAQTATLPGLLQTTEHARIVFDQAIPQLPPHEVEHRTSWRIKRQSVLHREDAAPYTALIHEAALRMRFGGPEVTGRQLQHIIETSERENVTVRVIPFEAGEFPGAGQTICYAAGTVPQLDTVQLDQAHGAVFLDMEAQLAKYRGILNRLEELSLGVSESRDLINRISRDL